MQKINAWFLIIYTCATWIYDAWDSKLRVLANKGIYAKQMSQILVEIWNITFFAVKINVTTKNNILVFKFTQHTL